MQKDNDFYHYQFEPVRGVSYFENNLNSFYKDDIDVIGIGNY